MSIQAVWNELREAQEREERPRIERIRVTVSAPLGSIVEVPMSPEHARRYARVRMVDLDTVDFFHEDWPREVVVHPEDWNRIMTDPNMADVVSTNRGVLGTMMFGIPVVVE